MSIVRRAKALARPVLRRIPGIRPAWHAVLRVNGRLQARAGRASAALEERRRRTRESLPIDHPTPRIRRELAVLELRNRLTRRPVVSASSTAVVTMTTHGSRAARAYLALESIARGSSRPGRLVLWIDEEPLFARLPHSIRRLQRRGLEVRLVPDYGVHAKYYPALPAGDGPDAPLVTADDDTLYPREWLAALTAAHRAHPDDVIAYRAHRMAVEEGRITPYATWVPAVGDEASAAFFGTSVSGQLLPAALQRALRGRGEAFRESSPRSDDVWIHAVALDAGLRVRLVDGRSRTFPFVPGTQGSGLYLTNYWDGGNDRQVGATYSAGAVEAIAREQEADR